MLQSASQELLPGRYYSFKLFIDITVNGNRHLGYAKQAIRDIGKTPPVIRWGSSMELSWPSPEIPHARWIDDPKSGLLGRTITSPEDFLGAEGTIGDKRYRFEQILDLGKNQVVFSLFRPENQTRIAYGFSREIFECGKGTFTNSE
jgi:hypothetical protein